MAADKKTKLLAKQLFKLSLADGAVSPERVAGVHGYIEKTQPRHPLALLKAYQRYIVNELAKSRALVEHSGPVAAVAQPNPKLLAGLRVRVGSDVYEASVAGQLAALSSSV
jgi:F-type H+-transporting ATPase subunit delta